MNSRTRWALAGSLVGVALIGCSRAEQPAASAPKITGKREVCLVIEDTFKMFARGTVTRYERFKSVKEAVAAADECDAMARQWNEKRPTLDAEPTRIGDAFAEKFAARAKIFRAAKEPSPAALPPAPTALSSAASPEELRKAALRDAAQFGLKGLVGAGIEEPRAELDGEALDRNYQEINDIHTDNLDTCIRLIGEEVLKH